MARIPVPSKLSGITNKIVSLSKRKYPSPPVVTPLFTFFMPSNPQGTVPTNSGGPIHSEWCSFEVTSTEAALARPILSQQPLHVSLTAPSAGYSFLAFRLATFGRVNRCSLVIEMRSSSGELLLQHTISTETLSDNQFVSCPVSYRQLRTGEELIVSLSSPDATEENCVAVWGLPSDEKLSGMAFSTSPLKIATGRILTPVPSSTRVTPHISMIRGCSDLALHTVFATTEGYNIPRKILPQQPFSVVLSLRDGSYSDISLLLATYARTNTCSLHWQIIDLSHQKNTLLAQGDVSASLLKDNDWWQIPTGEIKANHLALVISSRDATPSNCVAVWVSSPVPSVLEKESCLPYDIRVENTSLKNFEAFVPFFSTTTGVGVFYSGSVPNRDATYPRDYIVTKSNCYTGYFCNTEPGLKIFTIECSSVDSTKISHARLILLSDRDEIVGDMTFAISPKSHRKSFHLHVPAALQYDSGIYTYTVSAIEEVPFALNGECYKDEDANNLTQEWRSGVPVILAKAQSTSGLPEEMGAVPLHIPRYSATVISDENPYCCTEMGFRGDTLAALPIPLGTVMWSFVVPKGRLTSIEFALATYGRSNFCSVIIELYKGRHIDAASLPKSCRVLSRSFDARVFVDNEGFSLSFDQEIVSDNEWFTVSISSPDSSSSDRVALWSRAFSSHDGVHANLLQPQTEFLNATDYTTPRINTEHVARIRRESLRAHATITNALIIAESGVTTTLAEKIKDVLLADGITSRIVAPGVTAEVLWKAFPIDAVFLLGNAGHHFKELLTLCETYLIPVLHLQGSVTSIETTESAIQFQLTTDETGISQIVIPPYKKLGQIVLASEGKLSVRDIPRIVRDKSSLGSAKCVGTTIDDVRNANALQLQHLSESSPLPLPQEIVIVTNSPVMATRAESKLQELLPGTMIRTENNQVSPLSLEGTSTVLLYGIPPQREAEKIIKDCHTVYVPVGLLEDDWVTLSDKTNSEEDSNQEDVPTIRKTTVAFAKRYKQIVDFTLKLPPHASKGIAEKIFEARRSFASKRLPLITIISVLYGKQREVPYFLQALERQSYKGPVELLFVDDCSPDDSVKAVDEYYQLAKKSRPEVNLPKLTVVRNEKNTGNCGSRNRALSQAKGEIVMIVDADCLLNRDCLLTHAQSHAIGDCDVVCGYFNLETGDGDPIEALLQFERTPHRVEKEAELQDTINLSSFLNTITRNFSIKRSFLEEKFREIPLFDTLFSYSKDPQSGFGWEDVEMGYTLYERGARIAFAPESFSVHVSHLSNVDEKTKPLRSLKNFRRLLDKHPTIVKVARRWVTETFNKIETWIEKCCAPVTDDLLAVRARLRSETPEVFCIPKKRPLRILSYRWHCPHQYEIYKLPHNFTLLTGFGPGFTSSWNFEERPLRPNVSMQQYRELTFKESDYDIAILHFDENSLSTYNCNNVLEPDWGAVFQWFATNLSIPKIAVCHGTPQFYGQYNPKYQLPNLGEVIEAERVRLVRYLSNIPVICNSYQAQAEWGFRNSRVVWQGFDPTEFQTTTYEKGILSLGRRIKERPVYRGLKTYEGALRRLPKDFEPSSNVVDQPSPDHQHPSPTWARAKFRNYVNDIRQYSIYFNPTERSPMPRSRGEAMMCGLVPVSANNHDVEMFIQNGWNGFYSSSPEELGDFMLECLQNRALLRSIGARARETAIDLFNHDRFLATWQSTLNELVGT
jgi:glycosyltransferase involved in cell wall biosynthesis